MRDERVKRVKRVERVERVEGGERMEVRGGIGGTLLLEGDDFDVFVGQTALPSL